MIEAQAVYESVFRDSTRQPGFYFQDFGNQIDSKNFRQLLVDIKDSLSGMCESRLSKRLNFQSLGRFSHQHSSTFHRDAANEPSFLMLGYEPTTIESRVFVADFIRYCEHENVSLDEYLEKIQNVTQFNERNLTGFCVTELLPFNSANFRLLLLNNSEAFGVLHSARILKALQGKDRVINSMMMTLTDLDAPAYFCAEDVMDFVNAETVHR